MDVWMPLIGTLIGALAALTGQWVSHFATVARDRRKTRSEKTEEIAGLIFSARSEICRQVNVVLTGQGKMGYALDCERLKVLVLLYAPKIADEMHTYLQTLAELQDWALEAEFAMSSVNSKAKEKALSEKAEEVSSKTGKAASLFLKTLLQNYGSTL